MEENNTKAEELKDDMNDLLNIVQLLETSLKDNQDDEHIIRSVHIIQKMVKSIIDKCLTI